MKYIFYFLIKYITEVNNDTVSTTIYYYRQHVSI